MRSARATFVAVAVVLASLVGSARAQEAYPEHPVEVIVPWGAGGGADLLGRNLSKWMESDLKGSFPVLNYPGASGMIGLGRMINKPADGYTIAVLTGDSLMMAATPTASVKWSDLVVLGVLIRQPSGFFVPAESRFKTWQDVVQAVRTKPGSVTVAITGPNTADDVTVQYLASKGVVLQGVPFAKPGERYASVLGGHVDVLYEQAGDVRSFLDAKTLRPILFFSNARLQAPFAEVPTSSEAGYEVTLPQVRAVLARAGTDPKRLAALSASIGRYAKSAEYRDFLEQQIAVPDSYMAARPAQTFLNGELEASRKLLVTYGAKQ